MGMTEVCPNIAPRHLPHSDNHNGQMNAVSDTFEQHVDSIKYMISTNLN